MTFTAALFSVYGFQAKIPRYFRRLDNVDTSSLNLIQDRHGVANDQLCAILCFQIGRGCNVMKYLGEQENCKLFNATAHIPINGSETVHMTRGGTET